VPRIDRYLGKEILVPFAAGLLFLTQLLLATQLLARAEVLFGAGVSPLDIAAVVVALLPHFAGYVLPIAFMLGAVLGVARLAEDREVVALGAAGISPVRLLRVPLALGAAAGVLGVWIALWVDPACLRLARVQLNEIVKKNVRADVRPGTFFDDIPGYTLYAERVHDGQWENVLIHDRSDPATPILALAAHGRLEPAGAGQQMTLVLGDGEIHREDLAAEEYVDATFRRGVLGIALGTALTDRNSLGRTSNELSLEEAIALARPAPGWNEAEARRAEAALWRRIVAPLAAIPFALLALPLGASRRAGRAFGVGATIAVVVAHYLLLRSGEVLAVRGVLPPPVALQLPTVGLGLVGAVLIALLARRGPGAVR
jgi:lipopolysaccharide export system permease protein